MSEECKDLLTKMLWPSPQLRLSAEECIKHIWFNSDKEALEASLVINNYQLFLNSNFNNMVPEDYDLDKDFGSFIMAPNYYGKLGDMISGIRVINEEIKEEPIKRKETHKKY